MKRLKVQYEIHSPGGDRDLIHAETYETNSTFEVETMLLKSMADDVRGEIKLLSIECLELD